MGCLRSLNADPLDGFRTFLEERGISDDIVRLLSTVAVLIVVPIGYAVVAVRVGRLFGWKGWLAAWGFASVTVAVVIQARFWMLSSSADIAPFWNRLNWAAIASWAVALGFETLFLCRHVGKSADADVAPRPLRVGCLGFALGLALCFLPFLFGDLVRALELVNSGG